MILKIAHNSFLLRSDCFPTFKPGKTRKYSYHFRLYFGFLDGLADKPTLATGSSDARRVNVRMRGDTILGLDSFAECTYISVTLTPWNFSLFASSKAVGHFRVPKNSHSQNDGG